MTELDKDTLALLEDLLAEEEAEDQAAEKRPFEVTNDSSADWCIRKIAEKEAEKIRWKEHYEEQLRKVNDQLDGSIENLKRKLFEYFNTVPHKATKTQESYALPSGKLVMKKQQPKFERDNTVLVEWLEGNGHEDLVKVSKSADWAGLKKTVVVEAGNVLTVDGEIVPGITVVEQPDTFEVVGG